MNINFNIYYGVNPGEYICLNIRQNNGVAVHKMNQAGGNWSFELRINDAELLQYGSEPFDYYYTLYSGDKIKRQEWTTQAHRLDLGQTGVQQYTVYDTWIEIPHDSYLYSSAFTQCINRREKVNHYRRTSPTILRLKVRAPQLRGDEKLILTGSHPVLGEWDTSRGIPCYEQAPNEWVCDIDAEYTVGEDLEYKFAAVRANTNFPVIQQNIMWETCDNRHIVVPRMRKGEITEYELSQAFFEIWNVKKAGTLIPVFSLRTEGSFGVGDFGDLKRMIDWIAYTGQRILQLLPINDTTVTHTWTDSYPYSCISVFALHPQYIDLRQLPPLKDAEQAKRFETLRQELNALRQIDYERVNNAKNEYLLMLFRQEGKKVLASAEYKTWYAEEHFWLDTYTKFCVARDKAYMPAAQGYYCFVQFLLAKQMCEAHEYARYKRVILKGDIPIGVHRNGCDVMQDPRYFNLNGSAGAPPDEFSINGQNWGFPTYNWDEMLKDGCQWWVRRFRNMQKYFDAYRIDHVLGFFRIWEIPVHSVHGLLGQFQPALPLSVSEIESYGLHMQKGLFTRPYITKEILEDIFGDRASYVRDTFVEPYKDGLYLMKEAYNTQRKVEAAVINDDNLRDGLYTLISNVLFLKDHKNPELYHPRIAAQQSYVYRILLSDSDKKAFNRLYDDFFYRRNTQYWQTEAMKKLPRLVEATRMLVCAEDLGMIPDCVPTVLNDLRILSLEVQSMPKEVGLQFGQPERYPYRSVCTLDSHDMPTLRMWWDEDYDRAHNYYSTVLGRHDDAPHPLPAWLARDIMLRNLQSASMLCIISLQDWLAISEELRLPDANAERINIPANPHHYWRYRMHLNIDDMIQNLRFCDDIAEMIIQSGR